MTDVMIRVQDHDSIIRPLERGQQDVGSFGRKAVETVVRGHQLA
jgi:hypothetical protein